jgi:hypothetical protein
MVAIPAFWAARHRKIEYCRSARARITEQPSFATLCRPSPFFTCEYLGMDHEVPFVNDLTKIMPRRSGA